MGIIGDVAAIIGSENKGSSSSSSSGYGWTVSGGESGSKGSSDSISTSTGSSRSEGSGFSESRSMGSSVQGSQNQGQSGNLNRDYINSLFGGTAGTSSGVSDQLMALLGLGSPEERDAALQQFRLSPGYQFMQDEGARQVNANYAGRGALMSGAAMKALQDRALNIANTTSQQYLSNLLGVGNQAQGAGNLITNAGQFGQNSGTSYGTSQNVSDSLSKNQNYSTADNSSRSQASSVNDSWSKNYAQSESNQSSTTTQKNKSGSGLLGIF